MSKFHYIYRITNIILNKHYYGFNNSQCLHKDDIGVQYSNLKRYHFDNCKHKGDLIC